MASSLMGRALGLGLFAGGFWLLFAGFLGSNVLQGVLGGAMIPAGMWKIASSRRA